MPEDEKPRQESSDRQTCSPVAPLSMLSEDLSEQGHRDAWESHLTP